MQGPCSGSTPPQRRGKRSRPLPCRGTRTRGRGSNPSCLFQTRSDSWHNKRCPSCLFRHNGHVTSSHAKHRIHRQEQGWSSEQNLPNSSKGEKDKTAIHST